MHFDTGLLWVDVEDDFSRARRRHVLAQLAGWLRRHPGDADRLLSFDEVVAALGWRGKHDLGLQTIQLDTVVGTAGSRREFDRRFRPTSGQVRERWERLDLAQRRGAAIPPIEVYRVGGLHFVKDGHHRVSVAVAAGRQTIDAYVTEVTTRLPPPACPPWPAPAMRARASASGFPSGNRPAAGNLTSRPVPATPTSVPCAAPGNEGSPCSPAAAAAPRRASPQQGPQRPQRRLQP